MRLHSVSALRRAVPALQGNQAADVVTAWELLERLDESPWVCRFRARPIGDSTETGSQFVLKTAREDLAGRDRQIAEGLLRREAEASRKVGHRNLASTLAVERDGTSLRLIQPYLETTPLRTFGLAQPLSIKLWLVRQIAEALAALHEHGWLHGCLSPTVVTVVARQGHVVVNELGWARRLNSDECDLAGFPFMGDVRYSAPESLDRQGRLGPAADVYALGGIFGELVTGRRFWEGYEGPELVAAKRLLGASDLGSATGSVPFGVISLVRKMLNRDPLRRPSLTEVIESLVAYEIETFTVVGSRAKAA